jgi:hypothetical protein
MPVYIEPNLRILSSFDETDNHLKDSPNPLGIERGLRTLTDSVLARIRATEQEYGVRTMIARARGLRGK